MSKEIQWKNIEDIDVNLGDLAKSVLDYDSNADEPKVDWLKVKEIRKKMMKEEADRLAEIGKEFYDDGFNGCNCND